jgi:uncharacterized BrkB/YihY/UPF0761 family membrane protein
VATSDTRSARLDRSRQRLADAERRHGAVRLAAELARRDRAAFGSVLAAALAARIFLWALPFALLSTAVLGFLGTGSDPLLRLTDRVVEDPELRAQLASFAKQAEQGRYVTAAVGLVLLVLATVALARTLDGVAAGVWGEPRAGGRARLWRMARYTAALAGIAAINAAGAVLRGGPVPAVVTAVVSFALFVLLAGTMLGAYAVRGRTLAQGALLVAAGLEAMRLIGFYYLPRKLERSTELYGGLGVAAALLLWLTILARLIVLGHVLDAHTSAGPRSARSVVALGAAAAGPGDVGGAEEQLRDDSDGEQPEHHLDRDEDASELGHRGDVAEPDGGEDRDREVQAVRAAEPFAEGVGLAGVDDAVDGREDHQQHRDPHGQRVERLEPGPR